LKSKLLSVITISNYYQYQSVSVSVDRGLSLEAGDTQGIGRLAQYMARCPLSLARVVRISPSGQVVYRAEKQRPLRFPEPASAGLFGATARNFQVFQPLDFLAERTQHIPNKGEHLIRYYGHYSHKSRGMRARQAESDQAESGPHQLGPPGPPTPEQEQPTGTRFDRRRWAMLIKRIYHADPLRCPNCGQTMNIVAFIEARQGDVIRRILEHCGLWHDPPSRAPPRTSLGSQALRSASEPDSDITYEADPDFLERARREVLDQPELPWEA